MDTPEELGGNGSGPHGTDDGPVSTLRGAGVDFDTARAARVVMVVLLVGLVVAGTVLLVAGYRKNAQVDDLRAHGVPVRVTITHCLGLMGGTGSSPAGFECTGTYTFHGTRFTEGVPGSTFHPDRAVVAGTVPTDDPGLLSTPSTVASLHRSATLYVVGGLLLATAAGLAAWLVLRRRRRRHPT